LGPEINLSGISPAKRSRSGQNSAYIDTSRVTTFREFWARSAHFGQNGDWDDSRGARVFLCGNPEDLSAISKRPIFTKFGENLVVRCPVAESGKTFSKIFTLGVICPRSLNRKSVKQAPDSEQATGHGMHCREILFTPRCSPRAREFSRSVNFSLRCTVAGLRGVKVAQFSDFGLFSTHKTPKTYLPVTSLQPRGYIAE